MKYPFAGFIDDINIGEDILGNYDVIKKNVTVSFENQPVKYVKHSRNGKVKYTNVSSPCPGLPGKPPDYSGDTQEEGYAIMDECVFAYDPLTPDHIVGKYHIDKPKPALFWDEYTKNLQKEYEKGGTFNYQLTRFSTILKSIYAK